MADTRIKKHQYAVYLADNTGKWVRVEKATDFTRSMNPETEERDYIADEHPTTVITDYKPSEGLTIDAYKGNADFELFYSMYKTLATGTDAERNLLLVSKFDKNDDGSYYAEKCSSTVAVDEFNASEGQMSVTIYENGTKTIGTVTFTDGEPVFTADEE